MIEAAGARCAGPGSGEATQKDLAHVIITGGTGYVGRNLVMLTLARGLSVTILGRRADGLPDGVRVVPWRLGDTLPTDALAGFDAWRSALIHLAHDWTNTPASDIGSGTTLNETGTVELWRSARAVGVRRLVFVSSQSARHDAPNIYGRCKWSIEQRVVGDDTALARVGLVYGGAASGLFALMLRITTLPVLPMVAPSQPVQPIHVDEVGAALLALARSPRDRRPAAQPHGVATDKPITFRDLLILLAREAHGRSITIVQVPSQLALLGCQLTAIVPFIPTVGRERVLGLMGVQVMPHCGRDLAELGVSVTPIVDKLRTGPAARRAILAESRVLLRFVLGRRPSIGLQRLYARRLRGAGPLSLPRIAAWWPGALRFRQSLRGTSAIDRRIDLAAALAEVSPDGAQVFFGGSRRGRLIVLPATLVLECLALPFRLWATLRPGANS